MKMKLVIEGGIQAGRFILISAGKRQSLPGPEAL